MSATRPRSATAIRFDADLHDRLRDASKAHGVPVNFLINRAVTEFLDHLLAPKDVVWTRNAPPAGTEQGAPT